MKKLFLKLGLTVAALAVAGGAYAQQNFGEKWGATPEEQKQNVVIYNYFSDAYKQQNYDEALKYLSTLLEKAPKGSMNLYINAIDIYRSKALKATSLADKNQMVDSLMMLYDKRAENFGDDPQRGKAYILRSKAEDYMTYKPADTEGILKYFREAMNASGDDVDIQFVLLYFQQLTDAYKADMLEADEYMAEYDKVEQIFKMASNADKTEEKKTFEALFISSGAANCENIESMFKPRIEADPKDAALLEKTLALLTRGKCEGDFYFEVAEMYYEAAPSANTAIILALSFQEQGDYEKAIQYLTPAIEGESNPKDKANLCVRMAASYIGLKNFRSAADYARQAASLDSENGLAYYMLGQSYMSGASQCTDFDRMTVYWLVYDNLSKAKSLVTENLSGLDQTISTVRQNFPPELEIFLRQLEVGQSYTVRCGWVTGTTTVRAR